MKWRVFGTQSNYAVLGLPVIVKEIPFSALSSGDITINSESPTQIGGDGLLDCLLTVRNLSTAGQQIWVSQTPQMSPSGVLLYPGDSFEIINFTGSFSAISDIDGATLNYFLGKTGY